MLALHMYMCLLLFYVYVLRIYSNVNTKSAPRMCSLSSFIGVYLPQSTLFSKQFIQNKRGHLSRTLPSTTLRKRVHRTGSHLHRHPLVGTPKRGTRDFLCFVPKECTTNAVLSRSLHARFLPSSCAAFSLSALLSSILLLLLRLHAHYFRGWRFHKYFNIAVFVTSLVSLLRENVLTSEESGSLPPHQSNRMTPRAVDKLNSCECVGANGYIFFANINISPTLAYA